MCSYNHSIYDIILVLKCCKCLNTTAYQLYIYTLLVSSIVASSSNIASIMILKEINLYTIKGKNEKYRIILLLYIYNLNKQISYSAVQEIFGKSKNKERSLLKLLILEVR
jgi:hypothetical protein